MSFDKLAFVKRLEGPDTFSRRQAEALSEAFDQAIRDSVANPRPVEMSGLRADIHREFAELKVLLIATFAASLIWNVEIFLVLLRRWGS